MDIKHRKKDHKEQQALHSKQQEKENGKEDLRLEELDDLIVWNVDLCYNTSLFICSFLALVARCWMIHNPGEVVFDEVHFGKFASFYLRGEYYFDVHPPLAKLLLAGVGWLVGYDGHFLFETIGQDYAENNVPYIAFRIWCAFCGAAVIPVSFLIMKELGASVIACTLGALLLAFGFIFTDNIDNALVAQSRLILLDSMLWLTGILAIYFWIKFRKLRHEPFTFSWWFWLSMSGFGLALVTQVKMVGLFLVASVGIATVIDLWELSDLKRGLSLQQVWRHFSARAMCLIVLPFLLYLIPFYIHFKLLPASGTGDAFMSLRFQETLNGNRQTLGASYIPYSSNITLKNVDSNVYLHSHSHRIPLKHKDGRISSNGQQVNAYEHSDENSIWQILPCELKKTGDPLHEDVKKFQKRKNITVEVKRDVRYLRVGDYVRLMHVATNSFLRTHDVASPMTQTHMEVTTVIQDVLDGKKCEYEAILWKVVSPDLSVGTIIKSKKQSFKLINVQHNVAVFSDVKSKLPAWGFGMQELNGNKEISAKYGNLWTVQEIKHDRFIDGVDKEESYVEKKQDIPFLAKFFELQGLMIHHNSALTQTHPYSSYPITWPFMIRGISFWEKNEGLKQIYMLGNPFTWIVSILGIFIYGIMWSLDRFLLHRGIDDFGPNLRRWWDRSLGFLFITWFMHYIPFFIMGRMLFLHHYLPAFIVGVILTCTLIDFLGRQPLNPNMTKILQMSKWQTGQGTLAFHSFSILVIGIAIGVYVYFMPLTYGTGFENLESLKSRKWFSSWDLQHA